ncbi:MAG: hypothetical protein H7840_10685 [Alphaproteobacteria bacterium]
MATEIYMCKDGQGLRDGRLEYSDSITCKEEAEPDAVRRCQKDNTLKRIAYYTVTPDGRFKNFYTYTNQGAKAAGGQSRKPAAAAPKKRPSAAKPPPPPPKTLGQKILGLIGLGK